MKNTKGFTLVELLAVIVILAIIALITVPIVLRTIENSRIGAAEDSAWGAIEAVKLAYAEAQTTGAADSLGASVDVTFPGQKLGTDGPTVNINGTKPTAGTITINTSTGEVTITSALRINNYSCTHPTSGETTNTSKITCERAED